MEMIRLKKALDRIKEERAVLRCETAQFEEFREVVRLAVSNGAKENGGIDLTKELRERYRETVMSTSDLEDAYGESIEESLSEELTPRIATAILSDDSFTRWQRRVLLVATSDAINRREQFEDCLATEAESVETAHRELQTIWSDIRNLSDCTLTPGKFETLQKPGRRTTVSSRSARRSWPSASSISCPSTSLPQVKNKSYALNEYLYENLGTNYPVLSTIATALNQVVEAKVGSGDPERLLRADGTGH